MTQQKIRCAIYTRKSTEEGLEQAFNSLDAQREACRAYIMSQAGEGWGALPTLYDDGGFSGATLERPAIQRLLADIDQGRIDIVVVYKIDRLTRSLADFAKIVERFDKRSTSFVSVTQAFNTTSSMGRLTLNILLSFAQFEREVTAERIRDKFSASRKKGIFMGGNPPLGYDAKDRKLVINPSESETVRFLFQRYLELGSVSQLRAELDEKGISTKAWISTRGKHRGGGPWYIGPLRYILRNRVYVGDAMHKGTANRGEHDAILPRELFDAVQTKLDANCKSYQRARTVGSDALLTGLIYDDRGNAMSPSKSRRPAGRSYLYYVSQARIQRREPDAVRPVPAPAIEEVVRDRLICVIGATRHADRAKSDAIPSDLTQSSLRKHVREYIQRVAVSDTRVTITFIGKTISTLAGNSLNHIMGTLRYLLPSDDHLEIDGDDIVLTVSVRLRLRGGIKRMEGWDQSDWTKAHTKHDPALIKALAEAHQWRGWIETGEVTTLEDVATRCGHDRKRTHKILKLAFLAPDIQRAILGGRQRKSLTLAALTEADLPMAWADQRALLSTN